LCEFLDAFNLKFTSKYTNTISADLSMAHLTVELPSIYQAEIQIPLLILNGNQSVKWKSESGHCLAKKEIEFRLILCYACFRTD